MGFENWGYVSLVPIPPDPMLLNYEDIKERIFVIKTRNYTVVVNKNVTRYMIFNISSMSATSCYEELF